jgi:hypothetical protein
MIEKIVVTPWEGQETLFTVEGDFVWRHASRGIAEISLLGRFGGDVRKPKSPSDQGERLDLTGFNLVAGAGFEPAAFRL